MRGFKAEVLELEGKDVRLRLENGEEIWVTREVNVRTGEVKDLDLEVGLETNFIGVIMPSHTSFENESREFGDLRVENVGGDRLQNKLVVEVLEYDVEDRYPEAKSPFGYPLVELDAGVGNILVAHENVPPIEDKQPYHEKGSKWKILSSRIMIYAVEDN